METVEEMYGIKRGSEYRFRKTLGEADVYLFAGITGDFNSNHVDAEAMATSQYGQRVVHGALLVGFISTTSTLMLRESGRPGVAYGYDRVRFLAPVFFGDTIQVNYRVAELLPDTGKAISEAKISAREGEIVAVGRHIVYFMDHKTAGTGQ